jgi:hypothetical protein
LAEAGFDKNLAHRARKAAADPVTAVEARKEEIRAQVMIGKPATVGKHHDKQIERFSRVASSVWYASSRLAEVELPDDLDNEAVQVALAEIEEADANLRKFQAWLAKALNEAARRVAGFSDREPSYPIMTEPTKSKIDYAALWKDPGLGDGITTGHHHQIPIGKPKNFFRVHPDQDYRRHCEIYTHKPAGAIDEQTYILAPSMQGRIQEAQPATLVTVMYRDGSVRLWPIKHPRDGDHDNDAWVSARSVARTAIDRWVKLLWVGRAYQSRDAMPGYAPDPDWKKVAPFDELVAIAFGEHGVITDEAHPIYRELFGAAAHVDDEDDDAI